MQDSTISPTQALRKASARALETEVKEAAEKARHVVTRKAGRQRTTMRRELEKLKPDIMVLIYQQFTAREIFEILQETGLSNFTVLRDAITRWRKEAGLPRKYRRDPRTPRPDTAQPSQDLTD